MIVGVVIKQLLTHPDDRGYFREVIRADENLLTKFGQLSATVSYPGVIKAFHWHEHQDDLWYVASGNVQTVLYDQRPDSRTKGETQVIFMGETNPVMVVIPKGVAHGYRVLGPTAATVMYCTTSPYDPKNPDEKRIPFNDQTINFDWTTKNK